MKALVALLVIGMAVPAMAAQEGDAGKPAKQRMVCKRDPASQTRLGTKICRPAQERPSKSARTTATTTTAQPAKARGETTAAPAQDAPAPVVVASAADLTVAAPKKEKKICKRQESSVSRMGAGPKICKTAAEWRNAPIQDDSEKLLMHEAKGK